MQLEVPDSTFAELTRAYDKGRLAPFIGGGLSRPTCPGWSDLVCDLEGAAGVADGRGGTPSDLIRRASHAVHHLQRSDQDALRLAVQRSIYRHARAADGALIIPPQTKALADIWWPLVLTTNYDELFLEAWNARWVPSDRRSYIEQFTRMQPVGRGRNDCQRVLNSTRSPDNPLLWALQGFLPQAYRNEALETQLTIGHEEYRRQAHEAVHFRRAFAEIYRSRVLLFVGSGLQESYLIELFGEALELLGAVDHFHYALVAKDEVDPDFLKRRLQIRCIEYDCSDVSLKGRLASDFLAELKAQIIGPRTRTSSWNFHLEATSWLSSKKDKADLRIVRAPMPSPASGGDKIAWAYSTGIDWEARGIEKEPVLLFGRSGREALADLSKNANSPLDREVGSHIWRLRDTPVYFVVARNLEKSRRDARDARFLRPAIRQLLETASQDGFTHINSMLMAAGDKRGFPQYMSISGMIRGYYEWYNAAEKNKQVSLDIFVVDPAVIGLLDSGRLDLPSIGNLGEIRFWVELRMASDNSAPVLDCAAPETPLIAILKRHAIPLQNWDVSVRPAPENEHKPLRVEDITSSPSSTLETFGVMSGSTLIFTRRTRSLSS